MTMSVECLFCTEMGELVFPDGRVVSVPHGIAQDEAPLEAVIAWAKASEVIAADSTVAMIEANVA